MSKKPLDPNLASILDSIRATVSSDAPVVPDPSSVAEDDGPELPPAPPAEQVRAAPAETDVARPAPSAGAKAAPRKAVPPATRTVEEFLAELIRPQVEAWLSAHLPEIIQKQAAEEIARLTGRK